MGQAFRFYLQQEGSELFTVADVQAEMERRMTSREFLNDMRGYLPVGMRYDAHAAYEEFRRVFLPHLRGSAYVGSKRPGRDRCLYLALPRKGEWRPVGDSVHRQENKHWRGFPTGGVRLVYADCTGSECCSGTGYMKACHTGQLAIPP